MRPRIIIAWLLVFFTGASLPVTSVQATWSNFGSYSAADFYNAHLGLISNNSGTSGLIERVVDTNYTIVSAISATQIAIQDSNRAWATDGDSLYLGTNGWTSWKTVLGHSYITLVRATPAALFIYSEGNMYRTVGDTMLSMVQGIAYEDSIIAMDYISASMLVAVSYSNGYYPGSSIYLSSDSGASWTPVLTHISNDASVFVDTAHHRVFTGGDTVRVSADSGQTWTAAVLPLQFNMGSALSGQVFGARDCSGTFYVPIFSRNGTNTGIMRTQDDGNTFNDVGPDPFLYYGGYGYTTAGWVFDRGSTVFFGYAENYGYRSASNSIDLSVSYDGGDGFIPDSVASAITVSADTIYDTICAVESVPFTVSVASSICAGVSIDSISVVHSNGIVEKSITTQTLFGNEAAFVLSYSGTVPGTDSIVLRVLFHSLEWGFKEYVDVGFFAYSVSPPAELVSPDSLPFGEVLLGKTARSDLQITNSGCSPLRVDSVVSSNPAVFALPNIAVPFYVKRDSTAKIGVTFSPDRAGPAVESIELGTNAGHTFIELEGQGVEPADVLQDENGTQANLSIYPNPASTMLMVYGVNEGASYEMLDLLGRVVQSGFLNGQAISVSALPEGMYLLRCTDRTARVVLSQK